MILCQIVHVTCKPNLATICLDNISVNARGFAFQVLSRIHFLTIISSIIRFNENEKRGALNWTVQVLYIIGCLTTGKIFKFFQGLAHHVLVQPMQTIGTFNSCSIQTSNDSTETCCATGFDKRPVDFNLRIPVSKQVI